MAKGPYGGGAKRNAVRRLNDTSTALSPHGKNEAKRMDRTLSFKRSRTKHFHQMEQLSGTGNDSGVYH